ncbi:hypothetical protein F4859DRAFT_459230 [Xylaria cf. heliscus]|nr:hypothetical protein F4859DRAFT_459230 [Xylaria cf. heliscus]
MGSISVLSEKDANNSLKNLAGTGANKADIKSMEYHRQVLKSKMEEEKYGHTANTTATTTTANTTATTTTATTTTTTTTTSSSSIISTSNPAIGTSSVSGLDPSPTTTVISAAVKPPSLLSSSTTQMIIHRKILAGLPADPNASGTCSSTQKYVSPSDNIMSPCTAKLNALKSRHAGKAKPKSLFAQASAKKFVGENVLGARNAGQANDQQTG